MNIVIAYPAPVQARQTSPAKSSAETVERFLAPDSGCGRDTQITAAFRDLSESITSTGQQRYAALLLWLLRSREAGPVRALRLDLQS
jgi:hypothetical protein